MERKGYCKKCGRCCQVRKWIGSLMKGMPLKSKIIIFWRTPKILWKVIINGECKHFGFDKDKKALCKIYDRRPWFCREFPSEPGELIDKDCGYWFEN